MLLLDVQQGWLQAIFNLKWHSIYCWFKDRIFFSNILWIVLFSTEVGR
ncbi:hypothetical protein QF004_001664 [Chryseobacterium sp. MDT2-18]|nr:hypothetical protein [Chryseobacterium sp. MDT2-18]